MFIINDIIAFAYIFFYLCDRIDHYVRQLSLTSMIRPLMFELLEKTGMDVRQKYFY